MACIMHIIPIHKEVNYPTNVSESYTPSDSTLWDLASHPKRSLSTGSASSMITTIFVPFVKYACFDCYPRYRGKRTAMINTIVAKITVLQESRLSFSCGFSSSVLLSFLLETTDS